MSRLSMAAVLTGVILWGAKVRAEGDWAPSGTVITMIRGGCERRCPVYRVVIFADGTVIIEGHHYLPKRVLVQSQVVAGDVKKLVDRFLAIDYFHLSDDFGFKGRGCRLFEESDAPNVITTLVADGQGKSIVHHTGCLGDVPDRLTDLEHAIDETAHTARWLKDAVPQARH